MSIQVKRNVKAYKMTSMRDPVSIFEEFLSGLASERKGQLIAQSDAKMEIWHLPFAEKTSAFKTWILKMWYWYGYALFSFGEEVLWKRQPREKTGILLSQLCAPFANKWAHITPELQGVTNYKNQDVKGDLLFRQVRRRQVRVQACHAAKGWDSIVQIFSIHNSHNGQALAKLVPKTHCMSEQEWRNLGVQQSLGWVVQSSCHLQTVPHMLCWWLLFKYKQCFQEPCLLKVGSLHASWARAPHSPVQVPTHESHAICVFSGKAFWYSWKYFDMQETSAQQVICNNAPPKKYVIIWKINIGYAFGRTNIVRK